MVELATALIWTLRIVLPIILFCIYFKLQAPKDEDSATEDKSNRHAKSRLLAMREHVKGQPAPESMQTVRLVTQAEEPSLFVTRVRGKGSGRERERERERESRANETREERQARREERREKREGEKSSRRREERAAAEEAAAATGASPAATQAEEEKDKEQAPQVSEEQEKMHLECLLNYVAFNRKEQARTFIHEGDAPPPPPPKPPPAGKASAPAAPASPEKISAPVEAEPLPSDADESAKANAEAQMVLGGAIKFGRGDVAPKLYEQLALQKVEITSKTYTMMIESCVLSQDLKGASDFLMKMEANGFSPDSSLLDKVMELYSQQKSKRESESKEMESNMTFLDMETDYGPVDYGSITDPIGAWQPPPPPHPPTAPGEEAPRLKLSSEASLFVPSFSPSFGSMMKPPPPPGPPPKKAETDGEEKQGEAGEKPTSGVGNVDTNVPRTALKATSKAFQPSGNVVFNPYEYTWTVQPEEPKGGAKKEKAKGKGSGKNGSSGKADATKTKDKSESGGKGKAPAKEKESAPKSGKWKKKD
eukprot:TRINITY_DN15305_c0_g1_i1.p1 TRINITY_DN15305_c0_g1~~TRINITY_DN15305_c0_g1_i1.p1  ORF type:complete len:537 (-),score=161.66 TRINITY_DN15305_c0_g1_i1:188-1798(-)